MDPKVIEGYLLSQPEAVVSYPFGDDVQVFKVKNKMFATLSLGKMGKSEDETDNWWLNLKCDPDKAISAREHYDSVLPGYHMSKKHWNTILLDDSIPNNLIKEWIDDSYDLIVLGLPKKLRTELVK